MTQSTELTTELVDVETPVIEVEVASEEINNCCALFDIA